MTVRDVEIGFSLNVTRASELDTVVQSLYESGKPRHVDSSVSFLMCGYFIGRVCLFTLDSFRFR